MLFSGHLEKVLEFRQSNVWRRNVEIIKAVLHGTPPPPFFKSSIFQNKGRPKQPDFYFKDFLARAARFHSSIQLQARRKQLNPQRVGHSIRKNKFIYIQLEQTKVLFYEPALLVFT